MVFQFARVGHVKYFRGSAFVTASILFALYIAASIFFARFFSLTEYNPAVALAVAGIFFGGIRLWPFALLAAFLGAFLSGISESLVMIQTLTVFMQALFGGHLLYRFDVDPIFRRDRDAFRMIAILALTASVAPFIAAIRLGLQQIEIPPTDLEFIFANSLFVLLAFTPFVLRWSAKPQFNRTWQEIVEIVLAFVVLIMVCIILFVHKEASLFLIPVRFILILPLFVIALRLRPRFLSLALSTVAIFSIIGSQYADPVRLFEIHMFLILVFVTFYIITALEEHRRTVSNRLLTQVATLENAVARVTSESRAKNDFIAILAHELRNPLTPVVSGIELLKLRMQDPEDNYVLNAMRESMKTVQTLLNDLLDVSKISEGKVTLKKQLIDLEPVLDNAINSTNHHRKERHQSLIFKSPQQTVRVHGDPVRIEQIFSNLLTNASKYSNEGDTITMRTRIVDRFIEVEVCDQGVGLDKNALDAIFEPFQQIEHKERDSEGLGIGLSLVRDFVNMHGGTVWAESEGRGKGSSFFVRLPLQVS